MPVGSVSISMSSVFERRSARRKALEADLTKAYTDEEAVPPEWLYLLNTIKEDTASLRADVTTETKRFVDEPDIRHALARRERVTASFRERIAAVNTSVARLNLIAPHARFTRAALQADEVLRPLYRAARSSAG
jgi:hypothetical protein